jgi:hypothetical protein
MKTSKLVLLIAIGVLVVAVVVFAVFVRVNVGSLLTNGLSV